MFSGSNEAVPGIAPGLADRAAGNCPDPVRLIYCSVFNPELTEALWRPFGHLGTVNEPCSGSPPAPCRKLCQLFQRSFRLDKYATVSHVFHISGNSPFPRLTGGAPTEPNSLHHAGDMYPVMNLHSHSLLDSELKRIHQISVFTCNLS